MPSRRHGKRTYLARKREQTLHAHVGPRRHEAVASPRRGPRGSPAPHRSEVVTATSRCNAVANIGHACSNARLSTVGSTLGRLRDRPSTTGRAGDIETVVGAKARAPRASTHCRVGRAVCAIGSPRPLAPAAATYTRNARSTQCGQARDSRVTIDFGVWAEPAWLRCIRRSTSARETATRHPSCSRTVRRTAHDATENSLRRWVVDDRTARRTPVLPGEAKVELMIDACASGAPMSWRRVAHSTICATGERSSCGKRRAQMRNELNPVDTDEGGREWQAPSEAVSTSRTIAAA